MTIDNATTSNVTAQGSNVDFVIDDECGYVLDLAAFLPDGHEAYAAARAEIDPQHDVDFDLPSAGFMRRPADAVEAVEVDEYDYESQVTFALDDEQGFVMEQMPADAIAAIVAASRIADRAEEPVVEAGARSTRRIKVVAAVVDETIPLEKMSA